MGRGRAKAKQTKVARELKYSSPQTDFQRLQRELSGTSGDDSDGLDGLDGDDSPDNSWSDQDDWRR
ncbi:DUF3073 domain-containing protein [Mycobacterium sp.]|uniref:DUF3073 domain-containing protein n=1 Tax=Mycobacterium sp. TaxID=1785 RepID=UPI003F972295